MTRKLAVLDAPRHLGKRPKPGTPVDAHWLSYEQRQRDLVARLHARDAGLVEAPGCRCGEPPARSARSGSHGRGDTRVGFQSFTEALARRTREIVGGREFPVVLGGDCSILLGNMLALRGLGRYGLVFVDGRDEFSYAPGQQRHCGYFAAAGLDLALATGNGPDSLSNLNGLRPYVDERNVVLFGMVRDPGEAMLGDVAPDAAAIQQFHIERIREVGVHAAASEALRYLDAQKVDGFWIHVDGDVLDRAADPDEDEEDTEPGGLEFDELSDALRVFLSSERAAGLEMTIYDPELDPEGVYSEQLVDSVVRAFDAATM